jgi:dolichol-phosphate mannosyltransferase
LIYIRNSSVKKIVIIPTYNEKENILAIVTRVLSYTENFHVLIVDDGSPDGTAAIIKELQKQYADSLFLMERAGKQGLGTAYIAGFKYSLANGYDYIFEMDADFSHNPDDLVRLYNACHTGGADLSVGSRYVKGGKVENWPWDRILISKGGSLYARLIIWLPVRDTTAGFVCYSRKVLEKINLDNIKFIGYAFQIEMKYRAWQAGFKIKEVPITFIDRQAGSSKMSQGIVKEAVLAVWKMKFSKN